jgi:S1-C subfamily serine protease
MLGVGIQNATTDIASNFGLKGRAGIIITSVTPGGPADRAGLKENDIILKMNGKDVTDTRDLRNQVAAMGPGTEVTLLIWRNNAEQQVKVRLGELTQESASSRQRPGGGNQSEGRLGLTVETITPSLARQLGVRAGTQGVVVTEVDPAGPAAEAGVQAGDIITQVNRQPVRSPADVNSAMQKSNRSTLLLLNRGGQNFYVSVQ